MRVNNSGTNVHTQLAAQVAEKDAAKGAARLNEVSPTLPDQQQLSENSDQVQLSHLSRALANTDESRLEQLRAAVASGSYSVPATELSSRIVDEHIANSSNVEHIANSSNVEHIANSSNVEHIANSSNAEHAAVATANPGNKS